MIFSLAVPRANSGNRGCFVDKEEMSVNCVYAPVHQEQHFLY